MTEEEALQKIREIENEHDSENPIPSSVLKTLLDIALKQSNEDITTEALSVGAHLVSPKPNRIKRIKIKSLQYVHNNLSYLDKIVRGRPELKQEIIPINDKLYNTLSSLDFNTFDSQELRYTLHDLHRIFENNSELADKICNTIKIALQSDRNDLHSSESAYSTLGEIVQVKPELADKVFDICNNALYRDDSDSLDIVYSTLGKIVRAKPELAGEVFDTINIARHSNINNSASLRNIYSTLGEIVQVKPELADEIFDTINISGNIAGEDLDSLESAYSTLGKIVHAKPELADKVLDTVYLSHQSIKQHLDFLEETYGRDFICITEEDPLSALSSDEENITSLADLPKKSILLVYKACMRYLPLEETLAKYSKIEEDLRVAHKLRFSTADEVTYALEYLNTEEIINSTIISAQQRTMNILAGLAFEEAKIDKTEVAKYRTPHVSSKAANFLLDNNDWLLPASFRAAGVFGCYFPSYMKMAQKAGLSVHDSVYWMPKPMSDEKNESFRQFIQRNLIYQNDEHQMVARPLNELNIIAKNWQSLKPKEEKGRYKDVLATCKSKKYVDQRDDNFAYEAARWGTPEDEYSNLESCYIAGLMVPEPFDSSISFVDKSGHYKGSFLPRDDVRIGFFGEHTNCCQHFGGVGDSCAISTVKDPFSQLFVIQNEEGRIVAGSWVWENTEGTYREVCFDNIEAIGDYQEHPMLNDIYEQVGQYLAKEQNCRRVTIGLGYQDAKTSDYQETESISLPSLYGNRYSDACSQVLLAENQDAQPLDKTKECPCYVRRMCFADIDKMDAISYKCFPDSDSDLVDVENRAGFVLEDPHRGVVGYVIYDEKEKYIADMAVLPEYRSRKIDGKEEPTSGGYPIDKNASNKLMYAMFQEIEKIGGKWSADMRDRTSFKLLELMEKRGRVKIDTKKEDRTMSDGSRVYEVSFHPIHREAQRLRDMFNAKKQSQNTQIDNTQDENKKESAVSRYSNNIVGLDDSLSH